MSSPSQAFEPIPRSTDEIARDVVDAALRVHVALGPGLLESAYEVCLAHELTKRGRSVQFQLALPVVYEGIKLDAGYRIDLLVNNAVVVEVKSVEALAAIHDAQVLTYLRLSGRRLGLLINFNVVRLKQGIKRLVL
jgi:GxxExxY protein